MSLVPRQVRVVAALISHPDNPERYLVQQRLPSGSRALLWEFPGGKVEAGESDAEALVRECQEELAVDLGVGAVHWSTVHRYDDLIVELVLYQAQITRGEPRAEGSQQLRYATPQEMKALPFCEADVPLIDLLLSESGAEVGG